MDGETCSHTRREWGRLVSASGSVQVKEWCPDCGKRLSQARPRQPGDERLPVIDAGLEDRLHRARMREWNRQQQERDSAWWHWYGEYLESPEWQVKRQKVLERAAYRCEGCGEVEADEVHHRTYKHAGDEFLFELVALCRACHERIHADERETQA